MRHHATPGFQPASEINGAPKSIMTRIRGSLLFGLLVFGLMLSGFAHAQIAVQDGSLVTGITNRVPSNNN